MNFKLIQISVAIHLPFKFAAVFFKLAVKTMDPPKEVLKDFLQGLEFVGQREDLIKIERDVH